MFLPRGIDVVETGQGFVFGEHEPERPAALPSIERASEHSGFTMASEPRAGALLRTLAASRPKSHLLELGTGTGAGTAWLLDGMDSGSTLTTVDSDLSAVSIAREHLGADTRVAFIVMDAAAYLKELLLQRRRFGLVFADTWAGKYTDLNDALELVAIGGLYVVDDMLPQPNWPDDHPPKAASLTRTLRDHPEFRTTELSWSSGLLIATRMGG